MTDSWWVSWKHTSGLGPLTLTWPWWVSGMYEHGVTVCAAVQAPSEADAKEIILSAFDRRPDTLEWRFCERRDASWSPFNDRWKRADWMEWPEGVKR